MEWLIASDWLLDVRSFLVFEVSGKSCCLNHRLVYHSRTSEYSIKKREVAARPRSATEESDVPMRVVWHQSPLAPAIVQSIQERLPGSIL
jgi:hypothetical protein